jgi:hypothetical protein
MCSLVPHPDLTCRSSPSSVVVEQPQRSTRWWHEDDEDEIYTGLFRSESVNERTSLLRYVLLLSQRGPHHHSGNRSRPASSAPSTGITLAQRSVTLMSAKQRLVRNRFCLFVTLARNPQLVHFRSVALFYRRGL